MGQEKSPVYHSIKRGRTEIEPNQMEVSGHESHFYPGQHSRIIKNGSYNKQDPYTKHNTKG